MPEKAELNKPFFLWRKKDNEIHTLVKFSHMVKLTFSQKKKTQRNYYLYFSGKISIFSQNQIQSESKLAILFAMKCKTIQSQVR